MIIHVQSELTDHVSTLPHPPSEVKEQIKEEKGREERMTEMFIETEMEHCSLL